MSTSAKNTRHRALQRLRSLCGLTAEQFSRLTGIGYSLLVSVEQGRRSLSSRDALLISAATGVDPAFNIHRTKPADLRTLSGHPYNENSFRLWQEQDLPALRQILSKTGQDVFSEVASSNAREIIQSARARGNDLAVAHALTVALNEVCAQFGLWPSVSFWKEFEIVYESRELTAKERKSCPGAATETKISLRLKTRRLEGIGRGDA
jgi:transcriptional regulator with XRE-family HTH domain